MAIGAFLAKAGVGLLSGYQQKKAAEENRRYQEEQSRLAYERSQPYSTSGPAGSVDFDPETKKIVSSLSPEYQTLMDSWLGTSGMASDELQSMMGDPYKMEQEQFKRFEALNADAYNQQRLAQQEQAIAQGRTGTQGYYDQLAIEKAISQDRLGGQLQAMRTGMDYRQMLASESRGFGQSAMDIAGMLRPDATLGMQVGQGLQSTANITGVSSAGTNLADTKAGFWSGLSSEAQDYNFNPLIQGIKSGYSMLTDAARTNAIRNGTGFSSAQDSARRGLLFPK